VVLRHALSRDAKGVVLRHALSRDAKGVVLRHALSRDAKGVVQRHALRIPAQGVPQPVAAAPSLGSAWLQSPANTIPHKHYRHEGMITTREARFEANMAFVG
jgi:hypothetical protein